MEQHCVYPLANAKGVNLLCDVCGSPAWVKCRSCQSAFYCNREHQEIDWKGIHETLCSSLAYMQVEPSRLIRKSEQDKLEKDMIKTKMNLIEVCLLRGQRHLFEGKYQLSCPAAHQCLRTYKLLYKPESIELIPAYLILAEGLLGLGKPTEAASYLALVKWLVNNSQDLQRSHVYKVYRVLAKLYVVQEDYQQALENLAEDIYLASEEYGTDAIQTSGGYFNMANVHFYLGQTDVTNSLYKKVVDIWYNHLKNLVNKKLEDTTPDMALPHYEEHIACLDEAQVAEADMYIQTIYDWWEATTQRTTVAYGKLCYTMAMLAFTLSKLQEGQVHAKKALLVLKEGSNTEDLQKEIEEFLDTCKIVIKESSV